MADEGRLIGFQGKLRHLPPQGQGCRRSGPEMMGSQSGEAPNYWRQGVEHALHFHLREIAPQVA